MRLRLSKKRDLDLILLAGIKGFNAKEKFSKAIEEHLAGRHYRIEIPENENYIENCKSTQISIHLSEDAESMLKGVRRGYLNQVVLNILRNSLEGAFITPYMNEGIAIQIQKKPDETVQPEMDADIPVAVIREAVVEDEPILEEDEDGFDIFSATLGMMEQLRGR